MSSKKTQYTSNLIGKLLKETSKEEADKIRNRMLLAAKIEDKMKALGIKKSKFSELLDKQPSVITKWFSGTHNFTTDTLWDIERVLDMKLVNLEEEKTETRTVFHVHISNARAQYTRLDIASVLGESFDSSSTYKQCQQQLQSKMLENVTTFQ